LISLVNVHKQYTIGDGCRIHALDGVTLRVEQGEFVAIVGQSGSGKSTLMNIIGCLDLPTSGEYYLSGSRMSRESADRRAAVRNREIGFIFQGFNLAPRLTALENVELPLVFRSLPSPQRHALAVNALDRVGLGDRLYHKPGELSGGQQQRVAIARALAAKPPLILADEPTGNLDRASGAAVLSLIAELSREGHTVLLITHDMEIAAMAGRRVAIADGRLCPCG